MQRMFFKVIALSLGIALSVVAYQTAPAKPKAPTIGNLQGTVRMIAKDKSEITIHTSQTKGATDRIVINGAATKWGLGSSQKQTPSSVDQLKEGYFLNCSGPWEGVKLAATSCYFRETK